MKLQELIVKLQDIEKAQPGISVAFKTADVNGSGHRICDAYLLDVCSEDDKCLIVVGKRESDAAEYKSQVEELRRRGV